VKNNLITKIANALEYIVAIVTGNMMMSLLIIAALWLINIVNWFFRGAFNYFGILPRTFRGIIGIIISPVLHSGPDHLFFNSIPLFILLSLMPVYGEKIFIDVTAFIIVTSGILTWSLGRNAIHIGASGIIMGYWSYLVTEAYKSPSVITVIVAIIMLYYLGGLFFNLFPQSESTSWEGHLFGFIAGIMAAFLF